MKELKQVLPVDAKQPPAVVERIKDHRLWLHAGQRATAHPQPSICPSLLSIDEKWLVVYMRGLFV